MIINKYIKYAVIIVVLGLLAALYKSHNPINNNLFPKCLVKTTTGTDCPGCGSQRAVHALLNFKLKEAFQQNALMVSAIPYILTGVVFNILPKNSPKVLRWRKRLFGLKAIYIILIIVIAFWIGRNII